MDTVYVLCECQLGTVVDEPILGVFAEEEAGMYALAVHDEAGAGIYTSWKDIPDDVMYNGWLELRKYRPAKGMYKGDQEMVAFLPVG